MRIGLVISCLLLVLVGCKKPNERKCWKAHGERVTVDRNITSYSEIEVHDNIILVLQQDTSMKVFVEAGENLEPFVNAEVINGVLTLTNENKCDFLRSYDEKIFVYAHVTNLQKVTKYSTADIRFNNRIYSDTFRLESYNAAGNIKLSLNNNSTQILVETGPTDVFISGETNNLYLYHSGNGNIWALNMMSPVTHVNSTTTGECRVYASHLLNAEIHSYGNVYYSGDPDEIILNRTNRGELLEE